MQRLIKGCLAGLLTLGIVSVSLAQPKPADTKPAETKPAPPRTYGTPTGFEKVTVNDHTVFCRPNDVAWVKKALADVKPPKKPEASDASKPNPLDLPAVLKNIDEKRAAWVTQMTADLNIDEKAANTALDQKVIPEIKKVKDFKPLVYFLVTTQEDLKDLCKKTNWGEPKFHYAPVSDSVMIQQGLAIDINRPTDEEIIPALYDPKQGSEAERVSNLTKFVEAISQNLQASVAGQASAVTFSAFTKWIDENYIKPLGFEEARDRSWLGSGITAILAAKYTGLVIGVPPETYLDQILNIGGAEVNQIFDPRKVDLLNPANKKSMNPTMAAVYDLAMVKKAILVVNNLAKSGGESAIPKALKAVKEKKPADGKAMVDAIKEATKVDLTKDLQPW